MDDVVLTPEQKYARVVPARSRWAWRRKRAVRRATRMVKTDVVVREPESLTGETG